MATFFKYFIRTIAPLSAIAGFFIGLYYALRLHWCVGIFVVVLGIGFLIGAIAAFVKHVCEITFTELLEELEEILGDFFE